jgi:two-component system, NarL family, nitrate/nitrite response regulator NarL
VADEASRQPAPDRTTVVVSHRDLAVRAELAGALSSVDDIELIGDTGTLDDARRIIAEVAPDVVLLDVGSEPSADGDALTLARIVARAMPAVRIVLVEGTGNRREVGDYLGSGAVGVLADDEVLGRCVDVVRRVVRGEAIVDKAWAGELARVVGAISSDSTIGATDSTINDDEREIVAALARGTAVDVLANELAVPVRMVNLRLASVLAKLRRGG